MGGSSTLGNIFGQTGVYGTLGTPAPGNIPGGRQYSATWVDGNGNLWLFGGGGTYTNGDFDYLNDLWEFNPSTNEWAWMSGSDTITCGSTVCGPSGSYGALDTPAVGNVPGGRQSAVSWIDSKGNLWLFGGYGIDASGNIGFLNDLWEFNPSNMEWAWMGGGSAVNQPGVYGALDTFAAGNIPTARQTAVSWIDGKGNFRLFGGNVNGSNLDASLNDLWEYSPTTNEWAWVGGSATEDQQGTSGVLGTPAAGNIPGSRFGSAEWTDSHGNFWLCGGYGYDADGYDYLDDVWEFSPSTGEWAWMGGADTASEYAVYGTLGTAAAGNIPGSRYSSSNWTDLDGNLWLFGGFGFTLSAPPSFLNDLWELNLATSQWAWMSGSDQTEQPGVYGALGVSAPGNTPGARYGGLNWTDNQGNFWLFGGLGLDAGGTEGELNDLWEYRPTSISLPVAAAPSFSPPAGNYSAPQTVIISDTTPEAVIYYTTDGSTPTTESTVYSTAITVSATETLNAIATATGYSNSAVASATYTIAAQICSSTSAINVDYFTIAETDQDENRGGGGVSTNFVLPALGANGLPVYNPNETGTPFVPEDLLSDGEITWWSPALNKGGSGGTSDVVETGIASVTLPFSNDNFFPPNGTGPNDANGFQAAVLTGNLFAPAAETVSFTVSSDDSAFVYLDGQIACDDGGVHSATAVPCTTSTISAGTHTIQVFYIDLRQTQAALDLTVTTSNVCVNPVGKVPTITWPTPAPILYGTPLSSVQLDASSGGVAGSFAYTPPAGTVLPAGVHTLSTIFTPTDTTDYTDAIATVQLTVNQITPVIRWPTPAAITYGTALSSAQLDATSTVPGTFVYTPAAGTVLPGGVQTLSVTFTPTDTTDYATVTATVNLTVLQAATTMQLSASTTSVPAGTPFTLTATVNDNVSQTPSGTVTFYNGGNVVGTAPLANGVATFSLALTTLGTSTMTASYPGNANFLGATSNSVAITVLAATTSNLLAAAPNPDPVGGTVTFTSTLSSLNGTPAGSVTFYDGTTSLAVVPLVSGVAQFSTNALAIGSHNITSEYAGSQLFSGSTSNVVVEVVEDFGIAASPGSQTVYTGVEASYTVTISALPGFNLPVTLSCSQSPANTTCAFSPATISGGSLSSTLAIQTTAPSKTSTVSGLSTKVGVPLLAGFFLLLIPRRLKRHSNGSFIFFALLVSIVIGTAFTGCGRPSPISGGTPVGTQTVTVTGTATNGTQTLTHTATVTLNVKSLF